MKKAKRLVRGDTVALTNPAGMPPERFRKFIPLMERYLLEEGFIVKKYLVEDSVNPAKLADGFSEAWCDQAVRAVFPVCGGPMIFDVVNHLDPELLSSEPKIFCGSSALSCLSVWLCQEAKIVNFFGPHLPFLQKYAPQREKEFTVQSFWSMVMWRKGRTKKIPSPIERRYFFSAPGQSEDVIQLRNIYQQSTWGERCGISFLSSISGTAEGRMLCATLEVLEEMVYLRMPLRLDGVILFTEALDRSIGDVKRSFETLFATGALGGVRALFITALTERTDRKQALFPELRDKEKLKELCGVLSEKIQSPVLYGFPMGHGPYKLTMPQGISCRVDGSDGSVLLVEQPIV